MSNIPKMNSFFTVEKKKQKSTENSRNWKLQLPRNRGSQSIAQPEFTSKWSITCLGLTKQVLALTQLFSVGFSQSRIIFKKCVIKHAIKGCVSCFRQCPGPLRLTWYPWSEGVQFSEFLEAIYTAKLRVLPWRAPRKAQWALEGTSKAQRALRVETKNWVAGRIESEQYFPRWQFLQRSHRC